MAAHWYCRSSATICLPAVLTSAYGSHPRGYKMTAGALAIGPTRPTEEGQKARGGANRFLLISQLLELWCMAPLAIRKTGKLIS